MVVWTAAKNWTAGRAQMLKSNVTPAVVGNSTRHQELLYLNIIPEAPTQACVETREAVRVAIIWEPKCAAHEKLLLH